MHLLIVVLLICGAVCFLLSALGIPAAANPPRPRPQTLGLGLFFWILTQLIPMLSKMPVFILALLVLSSCSSCSTTTNYPAKNERNAGINAAGSAALKDAGSVLGSVLTSVLLQTAQSEMGNRPSKIALGQSASDAVWSQVNSQNISFAVHDAVSAFSAGKLNQTAIEAQKAADNAIALGQPPDAVRNAIAGVISTAADAPPGR